MASAPGIVAQMFEQIDVQPGQSVLEIGAGTGYNAALLAHLVGTAGHVTTIDIDEEVSDLSARCWRGPSAVLPRGGLRRFVLDP